jgi:rusticyanin
MTATLTPPSSGPAPGYQKHRVRLAAVIAAVVIVVAGASAAVVFTRSSTSTGSLYSYYQSMMGRVGAGSMMGGSGGSMMGRAGYDWMMGGATAPGWMHGGSLPGSMMGSNTDPGKVMGQLFADAPGPRVTAAEAVQRGNETPSGATVDRAANRIAFNHQRVHFTVVASPGGGPDETFRIAGLVNPTIVVPTGASITIDLVNADPDTAHGIVVTTSGSASAWMPMMRTNPAFSGAALWFLGNPTAAGMHQGSLTFTAAMAGTYQYLCPVPGHAQKGMVGHLVVGSQP